MFTMFPCSYIYNAFVWVTGKFHLSWVCQHRETNLKVSLACISILIKDSVSANQSARHMLTRHKKTFKSFKTFKKYQSLVKRLLKQRMVPLQVSGVLCLTEWIPCLALKVEPTYRLKKLSQTWYRYESLFHNGTVLEMLWNAVSGDWDSSSLILLNSAILTRRPISIVFWFINYKWNSITARTKLDLKFLLDPIENEWGTLKNLVTTSKFDVLLPSCSRHSHPKLSACTWHTQDRKKTLQIEKLFIFKSSFLKRISLKMLTLKNNDVSTVRRSFSSWKVKIFCMRLNIYNRL